MATTITASDFVEGVLAVAASRGVRRYSMASTAIDLAMSSAYRDLVGGLAEKYGVRPRFRIRTHPIHQSSPVVRAAVDDAIAEHLMARRNPSFRTVQTDLFVEGDDSLAEFLGRLPGDPEMYEQLAERFITALREVQSQGSTAAAH